jgi:hypothetical protein
MHRSGEVGRLGNGESIDAAPRLSLRLRGVHLGSARQIVTLVANGLSRRAAAECVGCAPSTITRTAARDRQFALDPDRAEHVLQARRVSLDLRALAKHTGGSETGTRRLKSALQAAHNCESARRAEGRHAFGRRTCRYGLEPNAASRME